MMAAARKSGKAGKATKRKPAKKLATKKKAGKQKAAKKVVSRKSAAHKPRGKAATKKRSARKTRRAAKGVRKTVAKKSAARISGARKSGTSKSGASKSGTKKSGTSKSAAKKPARRSSVSSNPAKKTVAKTAARPVASASRIPPAVVARKTSQSRRNAGIALPPMGKGKGHRLAARTPVGWQATVTRLRGFSPKELKELHANYQPRSVIIREAVAADYPAVSVLLTHAFNGPAEDKLVKSLRGDGHMICELVGEYHGVVIAHAGFVRIGAEMDGKPVDVAALVPLAVEAAFRRLGIGRRLVVAGLPEIRAAGAEAVFVLGDPAYYAAMGFSTKPVERFASPYPSEKLSVIEFAPGRLAGKQGRLEYPPPFMA